MLFRPLGNATKFTPGEVQFSIFSGIKPEYTADAVDETLPTGKEVGPWTQPMSAGAVDKLQSADSVDQSANSAKFADS